MATENYISFFGKEVLAKLRGHDADAKHKVVEKLVMAYHHNFFNRQEQKLADDILRVLIKDSDQNIRQKIATVLQNNLLLPHDIVVALASDIEDAVACPILQHSYLLSEEDLVELVSGAVHSPRLEAIARREALSANVSTALLYKKIPQVVAVLFSNQGAQIREDEAMKAVEELPPSEELVSLLAQRREISHITQQKLKTFATKAGFTRFSHSLGEAPLEAEALVEAARLYSLLGMTLEQVKGTGLPQLVHQLAREGRLSISLLLRCLCIGELALVEHALAQLAAIPVSNARILLRDKGGRGIGALYRACKLPEIYTGIFTSLISLLLHDETLRTLHPRLLQRHLLIAIADDKNEEAVEFATAIIHRAAQDLEEAEERFPTGEPLAGGELPY